MIKNFVTGFVTILILTLSPNLALPDNRNGHNLKASYIALTNGREVTITTRVDNVEGVTALGYRVILPAGWEYVYAGGNNAPGISPEEGTKDLLEFAWINIPQNSVEFSYTVRVPEHEIINKSVSPQILYRYDKGELIANVNREVKEPLTDQDEGRKEAEENFESDLNNNKSDTPSATNQIVSKPIKESNFPQDSKMNIIKDRSPVSELKVAASSDLVDRKVGQSDDDYNSSVKKSTNDVNVEENGGCFIKTIVK